MINLKVKTVFRKKDFKILYSYELSFKKKYEKNKITGLIVFLLACICICLTVLLGNSIVLGIITIILILLSVILVKTKQIIVFRKMLKINKDYVIEKTYEITAGYIKVVNGTKESKFWYKDLTVFFLLKEGMILDFSHKNLVFIKNEVIDKREYEELETYFKRLSIGYIETREHFQNSMNSFAEQIKADNTADVKFRFAVLLMSKKETFSDGISLLKEAGKEESAAALSTLGMYYYLGKNGFSANMGKARELLLKSAQLGDMIGQYALGKYYFEGKNEKVNYLEAYKWIKMSAMNGFYIAENFLKDNSFNLTDNEKNLI